MIVPAGPDPPTPDQGATELRVCAGVCVSCSALPPSGPWAEQQRSMLLNVIRFLRRHHSGAKYEICAHFLLAFAQLAAATSTSVSPDRPASSASGTAA